MALAITIVIALVVIVALSIKLIKAKAKIEEAAKAHWALLVEIEKFEQQDLDETDHLNAEHFDIIIAWLQKQENKPWPEHIQKSLHSLLIEARQDRGVVNGTLLTLE